MITWFLIFPLPQRLYREVYHKQKDKIHSTYDTPDIRQVKMNQENLSDVWTHFHTIHVLCLFKVFDGFFYSMLCSCYLLFCYHCSCGTKRSTTTAEASLSLCPSRPNWCTATTSMISPARWVTFVSHRFVQNTLLLDMFWNHFVFIAEIQRRSDVAERHGLLFVRHTRDGPRPQHHQTKGPFFHLGWNNPLYQYNLFLFHETNISKFPFTFTGGVSSGGQEEPFQLLCGPGHTWV